ncbi:hypothetical protein QTP70_012764 [Hemibagrus guttatus]|uniref:Uncharacterized protein n=1 Tax=Hemibagrus guttatus TaxID=175788 RepID=A0AAE0PX72_9TELE|nr:hypothetical protein QTP70_012764 [Hemibagrus guttatus]
MSIVMHYKSLWGTHGTRMHYGKKASRWRQCHALGNVLLGNLGSCHPCGYYFDMYHIPKQCCRPCTPFHGNRGEERRGEERRGEERRGEERSKAHEEERRVEESWPTPAPQEGSQLQHLLRSSLTTPHSIRGQGTASRFSKYVKAFSLCVRIVFTLKVNTRDTSSTGKHG